MKPTESPPSNENTVVLLTTWNRPRLLTQTLGTLLPELSGTRVPLVICDDGSTDRQTQHLLYSICKSPIRLNFHRLDVLGHNRRELVDPHQSIQDNAQFGFMQTLRLHQTRDYVLKLDDDVVLEKGFLDVMCAAWKNATADGHQVLSVAGLQSSRQGEPLASGEGYVVHETGGGSCCTLFRAFDIWNFYIDCPPPHGFDWDVHFNSTYLSRWRAGYKHVSTNPDVCYHAGLDGVHVKDEWNRSCQLDQGRLATLVRNG